MILRYRSAVGTPKHVYKNWLFRNSIAQSRLVWSKPHPPSWFWTDLGSKIKQLLVEESLEEYSQPLPLLSPLETLQ